MRPLSGAQGVLNSGTGVLTIEASAIQRDSSAGHSVPWRSVVRDKCPENRVGNSVNRVLNGIRVPGTSVPFMRLFVYGTGTSGPAAAGHHVASR